MIGSTQLHDRDWIHPTISSNKPLVRTSGAISFHSNEQTKPKIMPIQFLSSWLTSLNPSITNNVTIKPTDTGLGGFAPLAGIPPYEIIASIPLQSALTSQAAASSPLGLAISATIDSQTALKQPNPLFVFWLYIASGRDDPNHPKHAYLSSLPSALADVSSWTLSSAETLQLKGTNLGVAIDKSNSELQSELEQYHDFFRAAHPLLFSKITIENIRWAKSMYRSRGFPSSLLPPNPVSDSTYDGVGILLPLLDMFNHKRRTKIEWRGTSTAIQFVNGGDKIVGEAQIFNNYGGKSNDSLLISYGFAIADNEDDAFLLELVIGEMRQTFAIHRSDTDDHEQFPVSLWVALASLYEDDDDGENEDENEEGIAIGIDSVELLLETLSSRLVLFENIEKSDQNKNTTSEREKYIAYYLLGQQLVLSQAVETLKEMAEQ